jgi:hypothetical protein
MRKRASTKQPAPILVRGGWAYPTGCRTRGRDRGSVGGGPRLAASYASQAHHQFRPGGDPVAVLQQLCRGSTYFHVDGPTVATDPLEELVGQLADRYGLAPLSTIR